MTLSTANENKIIEAILEMRENYDGPAHRFGTQFGISASVLSRMKKGKRSGLVSHGKLISIGRKLGVRLADAPDWKIVSTETFTFITAQLELCQREGAARMLVDIPDIGKTTAAKEYRKNNKNVFYVDCSQCKTKTLFIKELGKSMGVTTNASIAEIIKDIKFCLQATNDPLVILDEFGDLNYDAFSEVKGLWNGTEGCCGWYAMGADGLKALVERGIANKRVGYAEFFRRFGSDFMTVRPPMNAAQTKMFKSDHAQALIAANMPGKGIEELLPISESTGTIFSLTRLKERIIKLKRDAA